MSFQAIEISDDEGRPVFLYAFTLGAAVWRYTSSDQDIVLGGYKWQAAAISDDGVKLTGEAITDSLSITCPSTLAPVLMFNGTPPSQTISLAISHYHEGDNQAVLGYLGEVLQVNFPEPGTAVISCDTISASMQRDGLRLGWQRTCPYALYDVGTCNADKNAFAINATITGITPSLITVKTDEPLVDGDLDGGFVEWDHPQRGLDWRGIEQQVGQELIMFGLSDGLYYGLKIKVYPGCSRKTNRCAERFNNLDNYGGVPDMPGKSPFDGDPVF